MDMIRNCGRRVSIFLFFVLLASSLSAGSSSKTAFELYEKQDCKGAYGRYMEMLGSGYTNWEIYYNAGNCLYRLQDYAGAHLYYLRAKRKSPRTKDIKYNLKIVRQRLGIDERKKSGVEAYLDYFTEDEFRTAVTFLTWLFFITAALFVMTKRELLLWLSAAFLITGAFSIASLYAKIQDNRGGVNAVVMKEENMMSGPGASYKVIAVIPAGMEADVYDGEKGWLFLSVAGKRGWLEKKSVEKVD